MTQVAIVGCGIIGATIAYELSLIKGLKITLIDEKLPASGSTGAALGVMMGVISHKTKGRAWKLRQTSLERYETLIPELETLTDIKIPFNRHGILRLCFDEAEREKWDILSKIRHSQNYPLEIWDRQQLTQQCPQVINDRIIGAIYSPCDRQLDPTVLTQALVTAAHQNGVNCKFGVKVQKLLFNSSTASNIRHCSQIQTTDATIKVDWTVIAAGLGTTPLTDTVDIRPVLGQALQVKFFKPLGNAQFQPVITGNDLHIVPVGEGNYWIGATVEFPDEDGKVVENAELLEQVRQQAIAFCPVLAQGAIVRTWTGKRPRPQGEPAPIIRKLPNCDNVLLATGHYRNGVLLAPATALTIRELIAGNREHS